uniref:Uncharacterized protein n=1 Tax=Romanomermis culicivorax TaxID=13658 RepID=A0A915HVY6_ROMCU
HLQTSADDGSTLNYVISGAGAFASQSAAHASDVPRDSSKFYHPHGTFFGQIFPVGSLGWTSGGFVYCRVNKTRAGFGYVDGDGKTLYRFFVGQRKENAVMIIDLLLLCCVFLFVLKNRKIGNPYRFVNLRLKISIGLSPLLTSMVLEHIPNSIGNVTDIFAIQTGKAYSTIIQHETFLQIKLANPKVTTLDRICCQSALTIHVWTN